MVNKDSKKVLVAMSGGVDSGTVAYLLQQNGYGVTGIFMRLTNDAKNSEQAAQAICRRLQIPFQAVDLAKRFKESVIKYFLDSYAAGLTPNPCVACNKLIKFGELLKIRRKLGAEYLATGHYVRNAQLATRNSQLVTRNSQLVTRNSQLVTRNSQLVTRNSQLVTRNSQLTTHNSKIIFQLFKAADETKDQSYFLYNLTQSQLRHILFPLGGYKKEEVKKIAAKLKLPHLKNESQDVCFLTKNGRPVAVSDFLKGNLELVPGQIKNKEGKILGKHKGLPLYTIGQRKGIALGGTGPYYVERLDYSSNTLYVANSPDEPSLSGKELIATKVNWLSGIEPKLPLKCEAVIRYRQKPVKATVSKVKNRYLVKFSTPQRAITPGQSVVFYRNVELLSGGIII